jgi:hypothetical protein
MHIEQVKRMIDSLGSGRRAAVQAIIGDARKSYGGNV